MLAENELNLNLKSKFPNLSISLDDYSTCFNLNALVKPFQSINIKNEEHGKLFKNLLIQSQIDKNIHTELISRIYDSLDSDSLPETYGAEDLFYISNDNLSLNPDQLYFHKSQIKNINMLDTNSLAKIYKDLCALPSTDIQFNVNSLNDKNMKVFLSLFPDLNLNDIEKIILNRPLNGYITFKNLVDISGIDPSKLNKSYIIFKPNFIKVNYLMNLEGQIFKFGTLLSLTRGNFMIYRSLSG
jgi:type II secretory pathway component PulK